MASPKITNGGSYKGALGYDFEGRPGEPRDPPGEWVGGSCVGSNAAEIGAQFKPILALRPETRKPIWRCSINLHPTDGRLTAEQWNIVSRRFLELMGVNPDRAAWCAVNHKDRPHDHAHLTLSRVLPDGSLWDRAHDVKRAIEACAQIERESVQLIGRQLHQHDRTPKEKRGLTRGEREIENREVRIVSREFIQLQVDQVIAAHPKGIELSDFVAELNKVGVEAMAYLPKNSWKGMSYTAQGISWPGGKLGTNYTHTGLQARGVWHREGGHAHSEAGATSVLKPSTTTVTPAQAEIARQALDKARAGAKKQFEEAHQAGVQEHLIRMAMALALMAARLIESLFRLKPGALGSWEYSSTFGVRAVPPTPSEGADLTALAQAQAKLAAQLNKLTEALETGDMEKLPEIQDSRFKALREQFAAANRDASGHDQDDDEERRQARLSALREGGRP